MAIDYFGALAAFVHAAETRSFTEAGRRLGLSSSAVGKAIVRLEEELGARLFHRSTRAITLTAEGSLFLQRSQRILAEFDVARAELVQAKATPRGKLRVSLPEVAMRLMPHLLDFQQLYADIELELNFSDQLVHVIDEGYDAVVRIGEVNDSRLTMRSLDGYRHLLLAAPAYLARRGAPPHPADLAAHACLRYRYPSSGRLDPWPLFVDGKALEIELPQSAIANAITPLMAMAEAGAGIALLPDCIAREAIAAGRLVSVLDDYVSDHRKVCLLWPSSRQSLPKIKAFVDFFVERRLSIGS
jgi:DNA-binding transcriptional LysR family regulator